MKKIVFWYFILVLLAYILPYTLFTHVSHFYGSFLFWIIFALITIGILTVMMRAWKNEN
ncbi:MAG: hypothetical protein NTX88_06815 [Candidatus Atribacteria bacterium]|nr:hypothetical protein [Candidatus Atribacteria bacterium]